MNKKDTRLNLRISTEQAERLNKAAAVSERPASEIVRQAIDRKLAEMARRYPELVAA
jgi:predicted DNA-binding protein